MSKSTLSSAWMREVARQLALRAGGAPVTGSVVFEGGLPALWSVFEVPQHRTVTPLRGGVADAAGKDRELARPSEYLPSLHLPRGEAGSPRCGSLGGGLGYRRAQRPGAGGGLFTGCGRCSGFLPKAQCPASTGGEGGRFPRAPRLPARVSDPFLGVSGGRSAWGWQPWSHETGTVALICCHVLLPVDLTSFVTHFEWDMAKYPAKQPLASVVDTLEKVREGPSHGDGFMSVTRDI